MTGLAAAAVFVTLTGHLAGIGTEWATILKTATRQVPRLEILKDGNDKPNICSGIVLNATAGFLLTAAHCVEGDPAELSVTVNGRHAVIAKVNRLLDLAVIRFSVKDEQAITLAPSSPEPGAEVAILGFNFGIQKIAVQFGRVSQLNEETKTLWIDGTMIPGQSGGSCIDTQGRLVGMTSRSYSSGNSSVGAAIPVEQIADFVQAYLPAK